MLKLKNQYLTLLALGCLATVPTQMAHAADGDITVKKTLNFKSGTESAVATREQMASPTTTTNKVDVLTGTSATGGVMIGCLEDAADTITDHDTATIGCKNSFVETKAGYSKLKNHLTSGTAAEKMASVRANAVSKNGRMIVGAAKTGATTIHATYWDVGADGVVDPAAKKVAQIENFAAGAREMKMDNTGADAAAKLAIWQGIKQIEINGIQTWPADYGGVDFAAATSLDDLVTRLNANDDLSKYFVFSKDANNKIVVKAKGGTYSRISNIKYKDTTGYLDPFKALSVSNNKITVASGDKSAATTTETTALNSWANAVSQDGGYIVGANYINDTEHHAFIHIKSSGKTYNMGTLRDGHAGSSEAKGISNNGSYTVGWSNKDSTSDKHGFVRQKSGSGSYDPFILIDIGALHSGKDVIAYDVSDDGKTVVGSAVNSSDKKRAFKWTRTDSYAKSGTMTDLGTLSTNAAAEAEARAVSADGKTIVGWSHSGTGTTVKRATRWRAGEKLDLGTLMNDNSGQSEATSVSDNGKIIVGKASAEGVGSNGMRAFIWREGKIYDLVNSQSAIAQSNFNQTMATESMGQALGGALNYDFNVDAGSAGTKANAFMVSVNKETNNQCQFIDCNNISLNATDYGKILRRHGANTTVTYTRGDYDGLTVKSRQLNFAGFVRKPSANTNPIMLGAFLGTGSIASSIENLGFKGNIPSKGIYLRGMNQNGEGLSWKVGYAHAKGKANIARYEIGKSDKAAGTATMTSTAVSVNMGYSFPKWDTMYTPYAIYRQSTSSRGAYRETSGSFPVSYSAYTVKTRTIQPGIRGETTASKNSSFTWDVGLIHRMSESGGKSTGTSRLVGFEKFNIAAPKKGRNNRLTVSVGYNYDVKDDMHIFTNLNSTRSDRKRGLDKTYTIGFKMGL